ncbi:flagellar hook protein FlgE [Agrobacterium tumefaciens]|uniref:Flagellar hook protein FlgE n=1 Tax=Agrobacterium tumefaciens TaxID=358 RepID=A0A176X3M4_AGRTU|nr:flagellar hook protein FlgE [Agrobacterium tumefaciens]OAE40682.1 hypothetical protein A7J57_10510 [Agrobacterium tumefaciens]
MSLFGTMKTGISGMNAQANRLGAVGDNIANAGTTGYKRASTSFSSMVFPSSQGSYSSGGVSPSVRYAISEQGGLSYTTSKTDLSIQGAGFFIVEDAVGTPYLTRAGSFTQDSEGYLVNAAGYKVLGYPFQDGAEPTVVVNGFNGLSPVKFDGGSLMVTPSTKGVLNVNLPADADPVGTGIAGLPPSQNTLNSGYSFQTVNIDETGRSDIYFTKINENTWEITAYVNYSGTSSGFPYDLDSGDIVMATTTLTFDSSTGAIIGGNPKLYPDPADPYYLDFSKLSQQGSGGGSSQGMNIQINMPSDAPAINSGAGDVPASANLVSSSYLVKQTLSGYAGFAGNVQLDVYYTKLSADTWEVSIYDRAKATAGGFPYGPAGDPPLAKQLLTFDLTSGAMTSSGLVNVTLPSNDVWPIDFSGSVSIPDLSPGWEDGVQVSLNLPAAAPTVTPYVLGATPADNSALSQYSQKSSVVAYDYSGKSVLLDVYYTKGADNFWEVTVFNQADANNGGFPYNSAPLATDLLEFDPATRRLVENPSILIDVPNGATMTLDMSGTTDFAAAFSVNAANVNGSSASASTGFIISDDGIVSARYGDGALRPLFQIALADVPSPDNLMPVNGNAYLPSNASGIVTISYPNSGSMGSIVSGALENSNVDIATELTEMIESQRVYTANSKAFQTSSELLDVLIGLKR